MVVVAVAVAVGVVVVVVVVILVVVVVVVVVVIVSRVEAMQPPLFPTYPWAWGKVACTGWGGVGGSFEPPKGEGGGSGKGALVTGQSKEAILKPLMMTHHLHRKAAWKIFFQKKFPPLYIPQNDQRIVGDHFESYMLWYLRSPPPPPPTSSVSLLGVPVTGAQKGGGSRKGARTPPPPPNNPIFPQPCRSSPRRHYTCQWKSCRVRFGIPITLNPGLRGPEDLLLS